jgi:pilus assembly protein Flp/PilA
MKKIYDLLLRFYTSIKHGERGATAVEYGIMVALIAVVIITAVTLLGTNLAATFDDVANQIP